MRPSAGVITHKKLWDPIWFLIHEVAAGLIWFAIGVGLEWRFFRIQRLMIAYLAARLIFAFLLRAHGIANAGWRIEVLYWLGFGGYTVFCVVRWMLSKRRG